MEGCRGKWNRGSTDDVVRPACLRTLWFPTTPRSAPPVSDLRSTTSTSPTSPDPLRVLLIEDDEDDYILTRDLLSEARATRFEVVWVQTPEQAIEAVNADGLDVCLVDYRLGERDGVELIRELVARGCRVPMVLLTGQGDHETDLAAMSAGASDFLHKAELTAQGLERSIRYAIQLRRTEEGRVRLRAEQAAREQAEQAAQELAQSEQRYRTMGDTIPYGVWQSGPDGEPWYASPSFLDLLGMEMEEVRMRGWDHLLSPEVRRVKAEKWRRSQQTGADWEQEFPLHMGDAGRGEQWVLSRGRAVRDGQGRITCWVGINLDITRRKQIEHELREITQTLETRVAERTATAERLTAQLRALASELTQAEQRERRRVAQTLHDHLQQILVAAKLRIDRLRTAADPERAAAAAEGIEALISQAIEASRSLTVQLSPPILHDRGLAPALEWLARQMEEEHALHVAVKTEGWDRQIDEDVREFLFQSVRELLFNVVKHADTHEATVAMEATPEDHVRLTVTDRGRGCDQAVMLSPSAKESGFGLFNIQQRLVHLGGEFHADTAVGGGCRIELIAPIEVVKGPERSPRSTPLSPPVKACPQSAAKPGLIRLLLVDDHHIVREGMANLLREEADIDLVGEASDGLMAVDLARQLHPDVIIMDVSMPRMNGIEATALIKREQPGIKVIGLSMHEKDDMAQAMRQAGASSYLPKGSPAEELMANIRGE